LTDYRKNPGGFKAQSTNTHTKKLHKRIDEIQRWLGLSDGETQHWKRIGTKYLLWMIDQVMRSTVLDDLTNRGKFPIHWKRFISETETNEEYSIQSNSSCQSENFREREESEPIQLLEPSPLSPTITLGSAILDPNQTDVSAILDSSQAGNTVAGCIIRNLDLIGKNLKKTQAIINKIHTKVCKDKTVGFISLHDLAKIKIKTELKVSLEPLGDLSMTTQNGDTTSGTDLFEKCRAESSKVLRAALDTRQTFQTLRDNNQVLSIAPLGTSSCTEVTEDTTDIFLTVHSTNTQQGLNILGALFKQFYHAGLGNWIGPEKSLIVEKVEIISQDGSMAAYPCKLDL